MSKIIVAVIAACLVGGGTVYLVVKSDNPHLEASKRSGDDKTVIPSILPQNNK